MKIEDINYTLPTDEISSENFDKNKWLDEHPIDYFKFIYLLLTQQFDVPTHMPRNLITHTVFDVLYYVTRLYVPDTLYKFISLNDSKKLNKKKFDTLQNKQIFMASIKDFNDPFDGKAFFYDPKKLENIKRLEHVGGKIIDDFTAFHRGTALTENDTSCMPMWAHYSNNHQGFCVAYDMKNPANTALLGCTFPIQYTDERLDITDFMKQYVIKVLSEIDLQISQGKKALITYDPSLIYMELFLCNIKHSTWKYEKEFRCTVGTSATESPYLNAVPKAIYIGMNCKEQNRNTLVKIAKKLSVPIYQMCFDELSESYALKEKLLDE